MTDAYDLDTTGGAHGADDRPPEGGHGDHGEHGHSGRVTDGDETGGGLEESLGVTIPDEHVGAFVAQAFEDVERDTTWGEAVDAVVAEEALDAWAELSPREQVVELLKMADSFDERAVEELNAIPVDRGSPTDEMRERFEEAKRLRRNADVLRDGIAAAYDEGYVGDDELVDAVESFGFDTATIAEREDSLDAVANAYDLDFRAYGGTLMSDREPDEDAEEFEAW
ncbi:hypothetical protein [Halostella litorea]|uniref:hypothetical protein n=1 Tax=Halostella litorea TaxID=2528831 RepID=UPI0010932021|nr:hypothetical protein [Halostella litorea]